MAMEVFAGPKDYVPCPPPHFRPLFPYDVLELTTKVNLADLDPDDLPYDDYVRLLFSGATYTYDCYANPLVGFDCTVFGYEVTEISFPTRFF